MKNKNFFYLQYDRINWENQDKTKINASVNDFIIKKYISKKKGQKIKIFDIGVGIGFFIKMLYNNLRKKYKHTIIKGCEPSNKNYSYFLKKNFLIDAKDNIKIYNKTFQEVQTNEKFDFVTAIYVFPHFTLEDLEKIVQKIYYILDKKGKFILVVANEKYLEKKLRDKRDLFIERNIIKINGKEYNEFLHYSDIPEIGKVIDYNREELFYIDLFEKNGFELNQKNNLNDNGFICTVFSFDKK